MNESQNHYSMTKKLSQKDIYSVIPFIHNSKVAKLIYGDRKRISDYLWLKLVG